MRVQQNRMLVLAGLGSVAICLGLKAAPEIWEITAERKALLPGGKEADGIIGDFVMRNDLVSAVISGNTPLRKVNAVTWSETTSPGCLIDLSIRGSTNDQLTIFAPSGQQGPVSYVRVSRRGQEGEVGVEAVISAPRGKGVFVRHEYRLKDGWQGVLVESTFQNESEGPVRISTGDRWTSFTRTGTVRGISWADAVNPVDKAGYAYAWMETKGGAPPEAEVALGPGDKLTLSRFVAVGRSPAEAVGVVAALRGSTGVVDGVVQDEGGQPIPTATVEIVTNGHRLPAYPDGRGRFSFPMLLGDYEFVFNDRGRGEIRKNLKVVEGTPAVANVVLGPATLVVFDIRDEQGTSLPCKVQFIGRNGTATPGLGPPMRARGCVDQFHSETGQFEVQVPPGQYGVIVTRGIEYSHISASLEVKPGRAHTVRGTLRRLVDTSGWISADFRSRSTPSGDNNCSTDDRIINLVAEHIEFAPAVERNRFCDWRPHIERLGLKTQVSSIPGVELTGMGTDLTAFPFEPVLRTQDGGAPLWQKDPRVNALVLRDLQGTEPDRWLQISHPDMLENFIDRDGDGQVDGGYVGLGAMVDGIEAPNGLTTDVLATAPFRIRQAQDGKESVRYHREFIWLQMLNRGNRYWAVAVSDAHSVYGNGVGGWRVYLPSSTDHPGEIDWRELSRNAKAGRMVLTTGPFLEVVTEDGTGPGGETRSTGIVTLKVRVQCTDWVDIDRVQVLVNGQQRRELNFTRASHADWFQDGVVKFDQRIPVRLSEDSHLIVVAYGEGYDLSIGYGTSEQAALRPCAYHNPIFVDLDGRGFRANGDSLGWPLPVKGQSVDEIKRLLQTRAAAR